MIKLRLRASAAVVVALTLALLNQPVSAATDEGH